jgi:hypothetical protein
MDPHSIGRLDPDEGKNAAKRQIKSIKINVIGIKMFIVTLFSLKFDIIFLL